MSKFYITFLFLFSFVLMAHGQWYFETSISDSKFAQYSNKPTTNGGTTTPTQLNSYSGFRDLSYGLGYLFPFTSLEKRVDKEYKTPLFRLGLGIAFDQMNLKTNATIREVNYPVNYDFAQFMGRLGLHLTPVVLHKKEVGFDGARIPLMELDVHGGIGYNFYSSALQHFNNKQHDLKSSSEFDSSYPSYYFGAGLHIPLNRYTRLYGRYSIDNAFGIKENPDALTREDFSMYKRKISIGLLVDFGLGNKLKSIRDQKIRDLENKQVPMYDDTALLERIADLEKRLKEHGHEHDHAQPQPIIEVVNDVNLPYEYVLFPIRSSYFDVRTNDRALHKLATFMEQNPQFDLKLVGFADSKTGNKDFNLTLSKNRAKRVYDYLIRIGVPEHRMSHEGGGETLRFSAHEWEKNRRTEIFIINNLEQ